MTVVAGYTWTGSAGDGQWTTAGNWNPSGPPTRNSAVTIDSDTVDMTGNDTVRDLTLGPDANLLVGRFESARLVVVGGTIDGLLQARSDGEVLLRGQINGDDTGTIDVNSSAGSNPNFWLEGGAIAGLTISVASDTGVNVSSGITETLKQSNIENMDSSLNIGDNATLRLIDSVVSSDGFAGPVELASNDTLYTNHAANISGAMIDGLGNGGNSIDLRDVSFAKLTSETVTQNASDAIVTLHWGKNAVSLTLLGQYAANFTTSPPGAGYEGFVLSSDNIGAHPGTIITYVNNTASV